MLRLICKTCGKPFQRYPSQLLNSKEYFCSRRCSNERNGGPIEVGCVVCGRAIKRKRSRILKLTDPCCSRACKAVRHAQKMQGEKGPAWRGGKIRALCVVCGKVFYRHPSQITTSHPFCSRRCYAVQQSRTIVGDRNFHWRGGYRSYYGPNWRQQRSAARRRDNYQCRVCGAPENGRALSVHHLRPFRTFGYVPGQNDHYLAANDLGNLVSLCPRCHVLVENGTTELVPLDSATNSHKGAVDDPPE
jgi:5-methylcytosine-specific restriction endonuclease McrA